MNRSTLAFWAMIAAPTAAFALSHAYRTMVTLVAVPLRVELGLDDAAIGLLGSAFHVAFGLMQLPMGVALDRYGPRRVVLCVFPAAIVGAVLTASASSLHGLLVGQWLVGAGCAPVFIATLVMISRNRPPAEFAPLSGMVLGIGGAGMLLTGTPLAWVVETWSWRAAFGLLAITSLAAWIYAFVSVPRDADGAGGARESLATALRQVGEILRQPQTLGIAALAAVTYASFISLRGLWLVPMLTDRYGFTLVQSGHVALAASIAALLSPPLFGRLDPGGRSRRLLLITCSIAYAAMFAVLAAGASAWIDGAVAIVAAAVSGYMVLQYADARAAFPVAMAGRALSVVNTAMFLGVAAMQWASGELASFVAASGGEPISAACWAIAAVLLVGTALYWRAPRPDLDR